MQSTIGQEHVELFQYASSSHPPALPDWQGWLDPSNPAAPASVDHDSAGGSHQSAVSVDFENRLAEETRKAFETGKERGRQEGLQIEREAHAAAQRAADEHRLHHQAELVKTFAAERDRYLQNVEQEVVRLALAVAARILRREAQMDPLLLSGAVRVALGQLSGSTEVRLRVPAADLKLWTEAIALIPNLSLKPTLETGDNMRLGDCTIETSMGSVDLGIRSQLGEIERGFFDRAASVTAVATTNTNAFEPAQ